MDNATLIYVLIGVVLLAAIVAWALVRKRRSRRLSTRFGPEYQHAIDEYGSRSRAEKSLVRPAERAETYQIRSLAPEDQQRFTEDWRRAQGRFVDDPALAIREADYLVAEVMRLKGYPMAGFELRAEDLSVDHPVVVRNYRIAHEVCLLAKKGRASTEDLRRAMVAYRELLDELLEIQPVRR